MTLHEAIKLILSQKGRSMTAKKIAYELNKNKWYVKADKSAIQPNQISARVDDHHELFEIDRSFSSTVIKLCDNPKTQISNISSINTKKVDIDRPLIQSNSTNIKHSFEAISNRDTTILILGSLPGDTSIKLNEYYGHSRNRFWKIISTITNYNLPITYLDKKELLLKTKIGIWDVAHKANRKGSLDSFIEEEDPNDLEDFFARHKNLKIIGFNGKKSEVLFDKYFKRKKEIKYISLPSTSPANQRLSFNDICSSWMRLFEV